MKKIVNKLIPKLIGMYYNSMSFVAPEKMGLSAFALFCKPRKGQVTSRQYKFLEDAKDLVLAVEQHKIQTYKWEGIGPTLFLLHGWESNTARWSILIPHLQKENYNIIAMDAPALGNSSGDQLNVPLYTACAQHVIDTYKPTFVIGHSVGGMTLVYNLYKYPKENANIAKVVTLGAPSELSDFMRQYKLILGLSDRMMRIMEAEFIKKYGFKFADFSTSKFAKDIETSGLLIHDELDDIAPYWCSQQVHSNWKNSKLITTQGLGHSLQQAKVRKYIIDFLKE